MKDSKTILTPIASNVLIDKDERGVDFDITKYQGIIRSLLYLSANRPDIMFSVCMCARYQTLHKNPHFKIVKCILRYLNGTFNHSLWYPKESAYSLVGYSNPNFVGCNSDRKSTSGTRHFFGSYLVSWHSKKQHIITLSTVEAEYIVADSCCAQVLWLKQ